MNKKFLSAILFGALMVSSTGTFVSCKDYDDDIDNLQEQIDKLATKEDMEAKLSQMQSAIDAAKATAEEALKKAEAAGDADEIAALEDRISKLEEAAIDVEALKKELKDAVNEDISAFRTEMQDLITEVEGLVGKIADMVTEVELVDSYTAANGQYSEDKAVLGIMTVTQVENKGFGPNNEITTTKDAQVNFGGKLVVRVSPTNAELTSDMISFINSNGDDLSELIKVEEVSRYKGELLTRASANTGLWTVSYNWNSYDADDMAAAKETTKGDILYAIAINNTAAASEAERNIVSSFDLTIGDANGFVQANKLQFTAGGENIDELKNRWNGTEATDNAPTSAKELRWAGAAFAVGTADNTDNATGDARNDKKYLSVKVGESFDVKFDAEDYETKGQNMPWRFYVTLDKTFAEAISEPSEINAWETYAKTMNGLNTLDENGVVTMTINDATAEGDIIGFRVYGINYDGTLCDPDGRAFYVYVGNAVETSADLTLSTKIAAPYEFDKFASLTEYFINI